jgi:hypothetical protein
MSYYFLYFILLLSIRHLFIDDKIIFIDYTSILHKTLFKTLFDNKNSVFIFVTLKDKTILTFFNFLKMIHKQKKKVKKMNRWVIHLHPENKI